MNFPSDEHESFIVIPHTFTATRVYAEEDVSRISPTIITLKIACGPIDDDSVPLKEQGTKAMVGFQRLKVWLGAIIDNVILIDVNSNMIDVLQDNVANTFMFIPGQPDDSMLSVLLHSKICAITHELLEIHSISLTATDTENVERYYRNLHPKKKYPLPGIEYIEPVNADVVDEIPWWERATIDVCEYTKVEGEEEIVFGESDPLAEIGKEYLTNGEEADIIVFDLWKKDK
jgi:hypothetical protein